MSAINKNAKILNYFSKTLDNMHFVMYNYEALKKQKNVKSL